MLQLNLRSSSCNCLYAPKIEGLGLSWFRRGFGIGVVHVELESRS
jgi:hypothetical protein